MIEINSADTLINVAGMALHHQDADRDADVADMLESRAWPDLNKARDAVESAQLLLPLRHLPRAILVDEALDAPLNVVRRLIEVCLERPRDLDAVIR